MNEAPEPQLVPPAAEAPAQEWGFDCDTFANYRTQTENPKAVVMSVLYSPCASACYVLLLVPDGKAIEYQVFSYWQYSLTEFKHRVVLRSQNRVRVACFLGLRILVDLFAKPQRSWFPK